MGAFRNFCENFIFQNNVKTQICNIKNLKLGHGLVIFVNDRVIFAISRGFYFREVSRKSNPLKKF